MKKIVSGLTALALVLASSASIAQETSTEQPSFLQDAGMAPVAAGFYITAAERSELLTYGCTAGPSGLLRAEITRAVARGEMCGTRYNSRLDDHFKEGAEGYLVTRMPYGFRITIYSQGINLNQNVKCIGDIPFSGLVELRLTCVNSASGQMVVAGTLSNLFGNGGAMALGGLVTNLTAPRAGNTNINVGSASDSNSGSTSTGGGGGTNVFNVSAVGTGGAGGNAAAGANSGATINGGTCGQPVC